MAMATQAASGVSKKSFFETRLKLGTKSKTTFWIILGTMATILSVAAAAAIQMRRDHIIALEQIERESRSFVAISGVVVGTSLDRARETLMSAIAVAPGSKAIAADPVINNVIAVNEKGEVFWDKAGIPAEPQTLAGTELLQRLQAAPEETRFISGSFSDKHYGSSSLALAVKGSGTLNQTFVAMLDAGYLSRNLANLQGARTGSLVVVDGKSRPVAATPFDESLLREVISSLPPNASSSPVLRYIERNGSNYLESAIHVPGYDLRLISVARAADALSNWYDSLPLYSIMIFGPSLLGAALAWALLNQIEQTSRSDTALRRTEERFELAVSGAKCGIWDWDFVNRRMYWSGAMNALVGRGKQPRIVPVEEIEQLLHPDDRNVVASIENAIRSGASTYDESFRIRHQDGQYVWIRAKGQMYRTLRSEMGRLSGIVLDISDQKSAVDRLNVAEKVLKTAFENAAEAFVLWDREGKLLMCNRRFMDFYGIPEAKIGDNRTRLLARAKPQDQGVDDAPLELYDAKGGTGTIELQQVGDRWLLVSERKAMDDARIMVATDITSLKQHEDELKLSRNRLHEQTVKLSDIAKTLEVEKLRAEEGNRSKTEFLANMSHELRTPLNAIIGFSDVMRNEMLGPLPQRYVEYATDIHRSGQHLLHLIDEVLNMARIDSGGMKLDLETLDVGALITDCVKSFEGKAKDANITFRTELRSIPAIQADKRALREVISNLLSNALKYNSRDGFVTIETRMLGDNASVWIHDTGVGITPANLPRVIKPFERLESATNANKKGGTGLGLAVSNALIEMHGGKLVIESEVDVGTSVYFTLPVAMA